MTKDEALKMAIEALDWELGGEPLPTLMEQARKACKEALEQPSAQEPIGYIGVMTLQRIKSNYSGIDGYGISLKKLLENDISLYTHPAPAWQGLSDDEISHLKYLHVDYELFDEGEYGTECNVYVDDFARAIEQALKEKNT